MMTDDDSPETPVYQTPSPYREAMDDMTERARRLEERQSEWLRKMERLYGIRAR